MILLQLISDSKEYWDLKLQLDKMVVDMAQLKSPLWQKITITAIPVIAIISGFLLGWFVPSRTFKKTREFEMEKRKADDAKERKEVLRKFYGQLYGTIDELQNTATILNKYNIDTSCFSSAMSRTDVEEKFIKSFQQLYFQNMENYNKSLALYKETMVKFAVLIGEFYYLSNNILARNKHLQISNLNAHYYYDYDKEFALDIPLDELTKTKQRLMNEAVKYVTTTFGKPINELLNIVEEELKALS